MSDTVEQQAPVKIAKFARKKFPTRFSKKRTYILTYRAEQRIREMCMRDSITNIALNEWKVCYNTFMGILHRQRRMHSATRNNICNHLGKVSLLEVLEFGGFPIVPDQIASVTDYMPPLRESEVIFVRGTPVSTTKNSLLFTDIPPMLNAIVKQYEETGTQPEDFFNV